MAEAEELQCVFNIYSDSEKDTYFTAIRKIGTSIKQVASANFYWHYKKEDALARYKLTKVLLFFFLNIQENK